MAQKVGKARVLIPLGWCGETERDIGRAAMFMASADSDYITGQVMQVDGGHTCFSEV